MAPAKRQLECYRLYLDESGDHVYHDPEALREPGHRYLALVACWLPQGSAYVEFHRRLEDIKQRHFPHSPDEPLVLHRTELINCSGPFWRLRDERARHAWDADLLALMQATPFLLMGIVIDKLAMKQRYPDPFHPYHVGLGLVLERYCGYLSHLNRAGDVMAEARGKKEDALLGNAYRHIYIHGSRYHRAQFFQRTLTSREIKLKRKTANIAGLQLADLLAHPVRQDILEHAGRIQGKPDTFGTRLVRALGQKYNRQLYKGRIEGYGRVLFPK
ncbi:MAG: DUF3800 domain-containing protein [Armatimonadota bacterium]